MQLEYNNNMKIKFDEKNPPDMEVFKCPKLNCNKFYLDYESRASHMALDHAEMPKFLLGSSESSKYFDANQVVKLTRLTSQTSIKKHKLMFDIFLNKEVEKKTVPKVHAPKQVRIQVQAKPKISFFKRLVSIFVGG